MTKHDKHAALLAAAQCPAGGSHHWLMYWKAGEYRQKCQNCPEDRKADETLGLGGKPSGIVLEGSASNHEYPLQRDFVEGE